MSDGFAVAKQLVPRSASTTRRGTKPALIVLHYDPAPAAQALAAYAAEGSRRSPHYHVAADGAITQLVPEERAALHSGLARFGSRRRNIDRASIGVAVEAAGPEARLPRAQALALRWLVGQLQERHGLAADAAIVGWDAAAGAIVDAALPPAPPQREGAVLSAEDQEAARRAVLGIEDDPAAAIRLWLFLQNEAARQRAGEFKLGSAFARHAAKTGMGAPLAPSSPQAAWITVGGRTFNYQHFARDTAFNEGEQWRAVRNLSELLEGSFPAPGSVEFELYKSAFAAGIAGSKTPATGVTEFKPGWAFTQFAATHRLGPALSGNYRITVEGRQYSIQVYGADTLYNPIGNPESSTDWQDVRRLSEAPEGALRDQLWVETYKYSGATYDKSSPFQQAAAAAKLGTPLSGVYQATFEGVTLSVQVFALDTLYQAPGGPIKRQSALPPPPEVRDWQPEAAKPLPTPQQQVKPLIVAPAVIIIPSGDRTSPAWPPKPDFNILPNTAARQALWGKYDFEPAPTPGNAEAIRILGTWKQDNIVPVEVPQLAKLAARRVPGAPRSGTVWWHIKARKQLLGLWQAWEDAGLLDLVISYHGDFNARFIRGSRTELSQHAFGTAFDINTVVNGLNWLGVQPALVGQRGSVRELVPIANAYGFYWGGHFPRLDGMHFEVAKLLS